MQIGDALDMGGLGKHIERGYFRELINSIGAEDAKVAREGGGMAGDVNDLVGTSGAEQLKAGGGAANAWGIKEESGLIRRKSSHNLRE